ncbi:M23 family metallopeptidase [Aquimarina rubra]|uniref:M23 family metallopeptidase n=1 Tax=Aquimarina rubra TaxID=1920033 RepID=A0ABW5LD46_9FLAO
MITISETGNPSNQVTTAPLKNPVINKVKTIKVFDTEANEIKYGSKEENKLKSGTEYIFEVKEYTVAKAATLEADKENIKWCFWLDKTQDKLSAKSFEIKETSEKEDAKEDFLLISKAENEAKKKEENFKAIDENGILYAEHIVEEKEGVKTIKLKVKFSKWLDGEKIKTEAYIDKPTLSSSNNSVATRSVLATPEIAEVYWMSADGERLEETGYSEDIYLYIKTLGLTGKTLDTNIYDKDLTPNPAPMTTTDDYADWEENKLKIEERDHIKQFKVGNKETYKEAAADEKTDEQQDSYKAIFDFAYVAESSKKQDPYELELYVTIANAKDVGLNISDEQNKFGNIKLTPKETIKDAFFAKIDKEEVVADGPMTEVKNKKGKKVGEKNPTTTVDHYEKLEDAVIGQKVKLVAECDNINDKEIVFKLFEKEPLLVAKDQPLPVLREGKEVTEIKATVENGYAVAEVELWKGKDKKTEFEKWKKTLRKSQDNYVTNYLKLIVEEINSPIPQIKESYEDYTFKFNACRWHDPLDTMAYRGWYGPGSNRWEPKSSAYLKSTTARNSGKHEGLDLYAPIGTTTYACVDGEIYLNYFSSTYGNCIGIKSQYYGKTLYFFYAHLDKKPDFKINTKIKAGIKIGETGVTGNANKTDSKKNHLHFEVRNTSNKSGGRIDPLENVPEIKDNLIINPKKESQT